MKVFTVTEDLKLFAWDNNFEICPTPLTDICGLKAITFSTGIELTEFSEKHRSIFAANKGKYVTCFERSKDALARQGTRLIFSIVFYDEQLLTWIMLNL